MYKAPEYASTRMLNERSDVYGFGVFIMEIISSRNPIDYARHASEVRLKCLFVFHIVFHAVAFFSVRCFGLATF